ncbi:MAG: GNAT family N-acetyltransferase [Candidatus Ozemobacteraceae bacterium]
MSWRTAKGEKWEAIKGDIAHDRLKSGIANGTIQGVLAWVGKEPVGWCTFGPRRSFPRLDRAPSLACEDADVVWSIPCFYVRPGFRGKGVATALLKKALEIMKARGAGIVEGYPSKPGKDGNYVAAFSWTGTRSLFANLGFTPAGNEDGGKMRVRKPLR